MRKSLVLLGLIGLLGVIVTAPSIAADAGVSWRSSRPDTHGLPYPRSERAAAVWDERACWTRCGSYCAWNMAACLRQDVHGSQGACLQLTDRCDRACQRECRNFGGPLVPDPFDALN